MEPDTEKPSKSNVSFSQVLPPLLLLPLFVMPWDATGLFYWIICWIAALGALLALLRNLSGLGKSNPSTGRFPAWKTNLRPLLTVAIFATAVAVGFIVEAASSRYTEELASHLQRECKERGRCSPAPEGWRVEGEFARSSHGHWRFTYVTNAEQSEFGLWVYRRNENEKCIHGGSTINLSEVLSVHCRSDPKVPSSKWQYERMGR